MRSCAAPSFAAPSALRLESRGLTADGAGGRQSGDGRHPAGLNFGDCLTYATAALAREPLLCVGDDFPQTDLTLAPVA